MYANSNTVARKVSHFTVFIIVLLLNEKFFLATVFEFAYIITARINSHLEAE